MTCTETAQSPVDQILEATSDLRAMLLRHPIYLEIRDVKDLRVFMQHHVFAVLDFMWLLKRLQREICPASVPWLPPNQASTARFINEIVLAEESDEDGRGGFRSHFELYLDAMRDVAASTESIDHFADLLRLETSVQDALQQTAPSDSVKNFVLHTFELSSSASSAAAGAAFCFGREDIIPEMFQRLLVGFATHGVSVPALKYYIERHIELDGDHHGPLTRQLVNELCGESPEAVTEAIDAARQAVSCRIQLWDGVLEALHRARGLN